MSKITKEMVETSARSDAAFDGRDFDALGRHDRERYCERSRKSLTAALSLSRPQESGTVCPACRETCAKVAENFFTGRRDADRFYRPGIAAAIRALPVPSTGEPTELRAALEAAADHIKDLDGGNQRTETGWKSDESLDVWLRCRVALDHIPPLPTASLDDVKDMATWPEEIRKAHGCPPLPTAKQTGEQP